MHKSCPHCHEETFGWRELVALNFFTVKECENCHKSVRNSGWRQLLVAPAIVTIVLAGIALSTIIPSGKSVFLIPVAVLVMPLVLVLTAKPVKAEVSQTDRSPFTPDPGNDKLILVQGWNEDELRKILNDFVEQDLSAFAAFDIGIQNRFENSFALTFPEDIHPTEFVCLIHYLAHPFDFDLTERSIIVAGKTTLNSDFDGLPKSFAGKKALLFLPENDDDYTVVYLQVESEGTLAKSLSKGDWLKTKDARLSSAVVSLMNDPRPDV